MIMRVFASLSMTYYMYFHLYFMMTSSNGNIFCVTGHMCEEFTGHRWIPLTKTSDAELWCFLDLCLNKWLSKQSWGWWLETLSCSLWRHCNVCRYFRHCPYLVQLVRFGWTPSWTLQLEQTSVKCVRLLSLKKIHLKMSSARYQPLCSELIGITTTLLNTMLS